MGLGRSPLQTSPSMVLRVNGKNIGFVSDLNYSITQGQKAIIGVDSPFPQEIAQGAGVSICQGSMQLFKLKGVSTESAGLVGYRNKNKDMQTNMSETTLGSARYSIVELVDRENHTLVLKVTNCMFASQSWRIPAKGLMVGSISFQGVFAQHNEEDSTTSII